MRHLHYVYIYIIYLDVGQLIETDDVNQFSASIAQLNVQSSGDGSAPVIDAVLCAAKASYPDSVILVFTDSSASDSELLGRAEAMIAEKNLKVMVIQDIVPTVKRSLRLKQMHKTKIRHRRQINDDVYEELEMSSNGQIIDIPSNEISELVPFVTYSVLNSNTIFRQAGSASGRIEYNIPVDSYTLQILIFVNGQNINVTVFTPQGLYFIIVPGFVNRGLITCIQFFDFTRLVELQNFVEDLSFLSSKQEFIIIEFLFKIMWV